MSLYLTSFLTHFRATQRSEWANISRRLNWNLAIQRRQSRNPFSFIVGSAGTKIDPQCAKLGSTGGLGRSAEHVGSPGDLELYKTGHHDSHL